MARGGLSNQIEYCPSVHQAHSLRFEQAARIIELLPCLLFKVHIISLNAAGLLILAASGTEVCAVKTRDMITFS